MNFSTVLIANRGEIALRVIRTCRRLGLRTVAVHTDLDADAPHVRAADHAVVIPGYLDIDAVVEAARASGAEAIHPGYGFLSERAAFARAVADAGLTLVGPTAEVMDRMGRKDAAREIAIAAGVPVVPSYEIGQDPAADAAGFAYPVLVKAAAGGGGKGMRIVRGADEYAAALDAARRESAKAFGDDTLLVEKYVERGRHIEVQVMADEHGTVLHLFERDCSTQRRHQKVLEEAPAPTLDAEARERVTSAAVDLAREVGYTGAGTVEFLLDEATGEFYFLEMNTRLQVEHPVTECVVSTSPTTERDGSASERTGGRVDLVELQLRVAAGEPLALRQDQLSLDGHAIEARVYAEDSFGGFLPQAGRTSIVRWPGAGQVGPTSTRVDHALQPGQEVSTSFDPMLGKVIVHGPDREAARRGLVAALDDTAILGLTTNTGFLRTLLAHEAFGDATIDTAWLDRNTVDAPSSRLPLVIAAWVEAALVAEHSGSAPGDPFEPDGWRLAGDPAPVLVELQTGEDTERLRVDRATGQVRRATATAADGQEATDAEEVSKVVELALADHVAVLDIDGERHRAVVNVTEHAVEVVHRGQRFAFTRPDVYADHGPDAGDGTLLAPMPGTVLELRVSAGQQVAEGETLGAMEAMKMELALTAPFAGTVTEVGAAAGDQVALGAVLVRVEPDE